MNIRYEFFSGAFPQDFFDTFCGDLIGEGIARQVYDYKLDRSLVIKFEVAAGSFQNVMEWEIWRTVSFTKEAKWFAPCISISPCGVVLIQKKAIDVSADDLPSRVPAVFTDLKASNWGRIGKQIVCRDYGCNLALSRGIIGKMRKADWGR